jgi:hypothetical protein
MLATLALLSGLGGCAITPVGPTERGNLAKGVMQRDINAHHLAFEMHAYASKESTAGGYSVGGGGCGCN